MGSFRYLVAVFAVLSPIINNGACAGTVTTDSGPSGVTPNLAQVSAAVKKNPTCVRVFFSPSAGLPLGTCFIMSPMTMSDHDTHAWQESATT